MNAKTITSMCFVVICGLVTLRSNDHGWVDLEPVSKSGLFPMVAGCRFCSR